MFDLQTDRSILVSSRRTNFSTGDLKFMAEHSPLSNTKSHEYFIFETFIYKYSSNVIFSNQLAQQFLTVIASTLQISN